MIGSSIIRWCVSDNGMDDDLAGDEYGLDRSMSMLETSACQIDSAFHGAGQANRDPRVRMTLMATFFECADWRHSELRQEPVPY